MYQFTRHKNGVTIATAEMPHMSSVSIGIWVAVGGRYEPAQFSGVSHFIEHMLFKGTRRRNSKEISQSVEGIGGYLNAFTTEETTCFYSKACHDKIDDLWDVLADMFLNSTFDEGELNKERNVIKEELAMYLDQPHHHVQELLNETLWPDQPLGRSLTGTEATLDVLRRKELIQYRDENYVTQGTLVVAAGRLKHDEIVKAVSPLVGRFPKGRRPQFQPAAVEQQKPRVRLFTKNVEQTQVALGIRACSRHDERRFALRLLNTVLGENMSSRLFQTIREEHGLAYSICSNIAFYDDVGVLNISAGLETEQLEKALRLIVKELRGCARLSPTAGELKRARDYVLGQIDLSLENTENQMMWLGEQLIGYGKIFTPEQVKQRLRDVTASEVKRAARDFFQPDRFTMALVSSLQDSRHLLPLIKL
ncbi:MAG: pitrilysin family protein [Verrucomicrobiota bacterium]|nr:pitrilysin family protein [Verrucomicrobiota bacterium]